MKIQSLSVLPSTGTHCLAVIERRGCTLAARYAAKPGQEPTPDEVAEDFRKDPRDFKPYNISTGAFIG